MGIFSGIWLLALGVLGASNLIIAKKPDAKELIAKLAPYQGWIGVVSAFWGVWTVIQAVLSVGWLSKGILHVILWGNFLAVGVIQLGLGLLLGAGVLKTFTKNEEALAKLDQTVEKLAPKQGIMGLIAIGFGIWAIVAPYILRAIF